MIGSLRKHAFGEQPQKERKPRQYKESSAQKEVVKWLRDRPDWLVMSLENASKRTPAQAARARLLGMEPGAPDLVLLYHHTVIFLEMKKPGGNVRHAQAVLHDQLKRRRQWLVVAYGAEQAIDFLKQIEQNVKPWPPIHDSPA